MEEKHQTVPSLHDTSHAKQSNPIPSEGNPSLPQAGPQGLSCLKSKSTGPSTAVVPQETCVKGTGESSTMQQSTADEASKYPVKENEEDPRGLQNVSNFIAN